MPASDSTRTTGIEVPDFKTPEGYLQVPFTGVAREVYLGPRGVVVLGQPPEVDGDSDHNCDALGCSSLGWHVLARMPIPEPATPAPKETTKSCPFCGGADIVAFKSEQNGYPIAIVGCKSCDSEVETDSDNVADAIAAWNRRAPSAPPMHRPSSELREALERIASCPCISGGACGGCCVTCIARRALDSPGEEASGGRACRCIGRTSGYQCQEPQPETSGPTPEMRMRAFVKRLSEMRFRPRGHEGDEENGEHYPDCEQCLREAIVAEAASFFEPVPCVTCDASGDGVDRGTSCATCGGRGFVEPTS